MAISVAFITQRTGTWKNLSTTIKTNTTHSRHSAYAYSGNSPLLYINKTGAPYSFARCRFEIFQVSSSGQSIMRSNVSLPFLRQMLCTSTTRDGNIAFHIYPLHLLAHCTNVHIKSEYGALRGSIFSNTHLKIQQRNTKQQHFNRHKMQKLKIVPKAAVRDTITNTQRQHLS